MDELTDLVKELHLVITQGSHSQTHMCSYSLDFPFHSRALFVGKEGSLDPSAESHLLVVFQFVLSMVSSFCAEKLESIHHEEDCI